MMCTVQRIAQMYRDRLGIGIPHPLAETCHMAEDLDVHIPCRECPIDYTCHQCDAKVAEMYNLEKLKAKTARDSRFDIIDINRG